MATGKRLPAVPSLSTIIPSGTEGGKEFARIVGLLLFHDSKRRGSQFNAFDDAAGDFEGLDSYERGPGTSEVTGYQFKFFKSPLSDNHRRAIRASLTGAVQDKNNLKLKRWVLVTPDDLINSGRRKAGGDVEWFEKLRSEFEAIVEIDHIGHTKLQMLFLQTPALCLYYYPTLSEGGAERRKSLKELRVQYDKSMSSRFGKIEFVGMSVYKEEASRRISLDKIYIPLSLLLESALPEDDDTPRVDPTIALAPGSKTVILGDPGCGKSTLLSFLALVGTNHALQKRCSVAGDDRLTIVVTLRRYADELKIRTYLSILDFIIEAARADFSLDGVSKEFFLFYLESGRAVILFDGLDELPSSNFKAVVRTRIESFTQVYVANTIVITSRIVGYEAEARFPDEYDHYRVAKLKLAQMTKFIADWYAARIDDMGERQRNATDLIRVVEHPDNESIRDLARNPLLLTIVALVHRIDAVLPDQRVVLYQKCTETLLNTWYRAKKSDDDTVKGRIERRNRLRIEAVAFWMHKRSIADQGRAVVPHDELLAFLSSYIAEFEALRSVDGPAEDQAEAFLNFIKNAAGLIIEAGDGRYSFIHLTFQEYLCATNLATFGETGGAQTIWDEISHDVDNPRWREIVRLLVASLKSITAQKFFVDKIIDHARSGGRDIALLLLGLLRDGVEPAEERAQEICSLVIEAICRLPDGDDVRIVETALAFWIGKSADNAHNVMSAIDIAMRSALAQDDHTKWMVLLLIQAAMSFPPPAQLARPGGIDKILPVAQRESLRRLILKGRSKAWNSDCLRDMFALHTTWSTRNPEMNCAAAIGFGVTMLLDRDLALRCLFDRTLLLLGYIGYGPHRDFGFNLLALGAGKAELAPPLKNALSLGLRKRPRNDEKLHKRLQGLFRHWVDAEAVSDLERASKLGKAQNVGLESHEVIGDENITGDARNLDGHRENSSDQSELSIIRSFYNKKHFDVPSSYWDMLRSSTIFNERLMPSLIYYLKLDHGSHWREALRVALADSLPESLASLVDSGEWARLISRLEEGQASNYDIHLAAWLMLFDAWLASYTDLKSMDESPLAALAAVLAHRSEAKVRLALVIRAVAYDAKSGEDLLQDLSPEAGSELGASLRRVGWHRDVHSSAASIRRSRSPRRAVTAKAT